jgi:hypothetical protein
LKREKLVVARDADLTVKDMVTHSSVSAFAFALYTMSMGPHWALLQTQFKIPNVLPGLVMVVFPMIVGLLGDTYVQKPDPEDQAQAQAQAEVAPLVNREVMNDSHPLKVGVNSHTMLLLLRVARFCTVQFTCGGFYMRLKARYFVRGKEEGKGGCGCHAI